VLDAGLRGRIATALSPRHVPDAVVEVPDIPRALSGKKTEIPVRKILAGAPQHAVLDLATLANPTALNSFVVYAAARGSRPEAVAADS
jgi:acetoacetyl-CoA synthetase